MGQHPVFELFTRSQPFDCDLGHVNFMGARVAHEFEGVLRPGLRASGRSVEYSGTYPAASEDYFEWIDLLTAIRRCDGRFVMFEVGAGYGRWIANAAAALRRFGGPVIGSVRLVALEASRKRFEMLVQNCEANGIMEADRELHHAACAVGFEAAGIPENGDFGAGVFASKCLDLDAVPVVRLADLIDEPVDFLDMDIQGAEADVLPDSIDSLNKFVKLLHVGTHGPHIEELIYNLLTNNGWRCRGRFRGQSLTQTPFGEVNFIDGIESWENPRLMR